jgi:hypothetical protein
VLHRRVPTLRSLALATAIAGALLCGAASADAQQRSAPVTAPTSAERAKISQMIVQYLASWNERDPARRRELIAKTWADGGTYVDPNRRGTGYAEIDAMIAQAQQLFPAPYALRLVSTIETHNGYVRFSWAAGGMPPDAPLYLAGTDFVTLGSDGRVQRVVGFADAPAVVARPSAP